MFSSFLLGFTGKIVMILGIILMIPSVFVMDSRPGFMVTAVIMTVTGSYMGYLSRQTVKVGDVTKGRLQDNSKSQYSEDKEWNIKAKYDDDIKAALAELSAHGEPAYRRFRDIYRIVNDKAKIPSIVEDVKKEFA